MTCLTWVIGELNKHGTIAKKKMHLLVKGLIGLANNGWCGLFLRVEVPIESVVNSDHWPLILHTSKLPNGHNCKRGFIYDATWGKEKACKDIVKMVWRKTGRLVDMWTNVKVKMDGCKQALSKWKKDHVGTADKKIAEKTKQLDQIQRQEGDLDVAYMEKLKMEIFGLMDQEELFWRQRDKEDWLKYGDRNTRYSHSSA